MKTARHGKTGTCPGHDVGLEELSAGVEVVTYEFTAPNGIEQAVALSNGLFCKGSID